MFNVKADLPQNVSGKYTYYQSAFDLKKCCWNYTMFSLGFLGFFPGNGVYVSKKKDEADHSRSEAV